MRRLHLWLGLASGLIVFIVSITGCIYVFEEEIKAVVYRDRLQVAHDGTPPRPLSLLWDKAQTALGASYPIRTVEIPGAPDKSYIFSSSKTDPDALTYFGEQIHYQRAFLNPYTGDVLKVENTKYEFFALVVWLHWSLLLSTKVGQPIVGTAVAVFAVQLLIGLVLWWPRSRAALRTRLRVSWRAKWRRLNWDMHSVLGFYTLLPALIIAFTGLVWAFHVFDDAVYFLVTGGNSRVEEAKVFSDTTRSGPAPLDLTLDRFRAEHPGFRALHLALPEAKSGVMSAYAQFGEHTNFPYVWQQLDRHTGVVLSTETFEELDRGNKLRSMNYDLHVGSILGMPGKILAFAASLICASLPITGFLIWRGKRRKRTP